MSEWPTQLLQYKIAKKGWTTALSDEMILFGTAHFLFHQRLTSFKHVLTVNVVDDNYTVSTFCLVIGLFRWHDMVSTAPNLLCQTNKSYHSGPWFNPGHCVLQNTHRTRNASLCFPSPLCLCWVISPWSALDVLFIRLIKSMSHAIKNTKYLTFASCFKAFQNTLTKTSAWSLYAFTNVMCLFFPHLVYQLQEHQHHLFSLKLRDNGCYDEMVLRAGVSVFLHGLCEPLPIICVLN